MMSLDPSPQLHIETFGNSSNPMVVCLHGLLGSARSVYKLSKQIADTGYFVLAYDQRGHGHSPHLPEYTLEAMANDLWSLVSAKNRKRTHLVGHSMGARVCLTAAAQNPDQVLSLSILDIGLKLNPVALQNLQDIVMPLPSSFSSKEEANDYLEKFPISLQQFLLSNLRSQKDSLHYGWLFDLDGIRSKLLPALQVDQTENWKKWASFEKPTLLLRGEQSEHFTMQELEDMRALNPKAKIETIPQAGHWLHADNFNGTLNSIVSFLHTCV